MSRIDKLSETNKYDIFAGWMYANLSDYDFVRQMGVFGPMIYEDSKGFNKVLRNPLEGTISQCYCTREVLSKLDKHYQTWWENNYLYYEKGHNYPSCHFSRVSVEFLEKRRSSEYSSGAKNAQS